MANVADKNQSIETIKKLVEASKEQGLDTFALAGRFVNEEISRAFTAALPARHCIMGPSIFSQNDRQSTSMTLAFVRKFEVEELQNAFARIKPLLALKGIELTKTHVNPIFVDGDHAHGVDIEAKIGSAKLSTSMVIQGGNVHLPRDIPRLRESAKLFEGHEPLRAFFESEQSFAARLLIRMCFRPTSVTWNDYSDLVMISDRNLDPAAVADAFRERLRTTERVGSNDKIKAALPAVPPALDLDLAPSRAQPWKLYAAKHGHGISTDFTDVLCASRAYYHVVTQEMLKRMTATGFKYSRPAVNQSHEHNRVLRLYREQEAVGLPGNVVELVYRPKF